MLGSRIFAVCLCVALTSLTLPAMAQGIGQSLAPPSDALERPGEPPTDEAEPAPDQLEVPEPPGAGEQPEDVRYPVPTPDVTGAQPDEPSIRISSRITTRLRALDANLRTLGARGGGNIVNAVLSMLTGGLSITLGAFAVEPMNIYLYVYGGVAAARGVLDLALTPNASGAAITYQHMPMTTRDEVQERLRFGEDALKGLAEQALIARVLDASLNMGAGVAIVPIYLAPNDFEISDPLDYFVLIGAGVSLISGIITLASTSSEEQRWQAYERLRDRLDEEHREESSPVDEDESDLAAIELRERESFSVRPTLAGLSVQF